MHVNTITFQRRLLRSKGVALPGQKIRLLTRIYGLAFGTIAAGEVFWRDDLAGKRDVALNSSVLVA